MAVLAPGVVDRIKSILTWNPRGMTVSDISVKLKINRNVAAKYLDIMLMAGQVEMQQIGPAKVYYLSSRVPVSAVFEFSSDLIIMIGEDNRIHSVNEQVPLVLDMDRKDLMGKRIAEIDNPFIRSLPVSDMGENESRGGERVTGLSCTLRGEECSFRVKSVPTAFEDGSHGITLIIEDVTARKKYQTMLEISEARYRGIVQSSGEAIIGKTPEGKIVSWNPAAERLFLYPGESILGQTIHLLVPPEEHDRLDRFLRKAGQGEFVRESGMKMVRKDGTTIDALITISPIRAESGGIVGVSSIIRDITREKLEQNLRDCEDRYRPLVQDLNVGIYRSTGDPSGYFVWGNTALLDILGYRSFSDLKDVRVIDIFSEPDGRLELLAELRKSGFVKNRPLYLKRKDGRAITVCVTALAEFDDNQNVKFINGIVQDITGSAETGR